MLIRQSNQLVMSSLFDLKKYWCMLAVRLGYTPVFLPCGHEVFGSIAYLFSLFLHNIVFPPLIFTLSGSVRVPSEEVALLLSGELTHSHLTVHRSCKYSDNLLRAVLRTVSPDTSDTLGARTVPAGPVVLRQPVRVPRGGALFFVLGLLAGSLLGGAVLTLTSTQCPPALGHIPTQRFAEVRLEDQIDNRVVKGRGLGKDCCYGKGHGWHI